MVSTVWIVVAVLVVVALAAAAAWYVNNRGRTGGRKLSERFGPEYERTLARHDGDAEATERELNERLQRHGDLRPRPLEPAEREKYLATWQGLQERFVDVPGQVVAEVDQLVARLAADRGFPAADQYDEQVAALSVHHPHRVEGFRQVHRAARGAEESGTESLREAMVGARALFDELVAGRSGDGHRPAADDVRGSAPADSRDSQHGPSLRPKGSSTS